MTRSSVTVVAIIISWMAGISFGVPSAGRAAASTAKRMAQVRYIDHGLTVQPPRDSLRPAHLKMPLYNGYMLQTQQHERASIAFHDGTVLHLNEQTNAVLSDPHSTYLRRGEVDEVLAPGTIHRVQTATAVASAIGTNFDIEIQGRRSVLIVASGMLQVQNAKGAVDVAPNQQTVVNPGGGPSAPTAANAQQAIAWTKGMPTPVLGENLALDANGGKVVAVTSERKGHEATNVDDGKLDTSWETAPGQVKNQSLVIALPGAKIWHITGFIIDPAATNAVSPKTDLKAFAVDFSSRSAQPADFSGTLSGTLQQGNRLQRYSLSMNAKFVRLTLRSNYGSADGISVAEVEVIGLPLAQVTKALTR